MNSFVIVEPLELMHVDVEQAQSTVLRSYSVSWQRWGSGQVAIGQAGNRPHGNKRSSHKYTSITATIPLAPCSSIVCAFFIDDTIQTWRT
jgi:hypothetical protein